MSNYTKTTDFEAKDSLPTGDSGKIIRGSEFETEFDAISTAIATKADTAGPTFTGTLTFETISDGTISVTAFVDEDDMSSDSATLVPTQQSVKAYVDAQVTAQDLDFQADTGGALSIDLDSETLTFTGGTGIDTSGSGNAVTFAIDSTVATLTGTQTLTNKTLTSPDVNTPDIDGGTIDGTVIGGTTAAAGSFTTVSATGNITVDGTVDGRDVATDGTKLDTVETNADVTDTTNVTAAGALMDSELTSEASVKALNQGVATTDSPTFAGVTVNGTVEFDGLSGTGAVSVTDILDQDDMSSNSATALATQQSIKAYVDSQVGANNELSEVLGNGNTTGGTDIAVGTGDDITFADSSKAIFGASSDLQIYHDGSNSYIDDAGTGDLYIRANNLRLANADGSEQTINTNNGGNVELAYAGTVRLATTSTGIDVTGTAEADTLETSTASGGLINIVRDDPTIGTNNSLGAIYWNSTEDSGTTVNQGAAILALADQNHSTIASGSRLSLQTTAVSATTPTERLRISAGGDISFYEDTGTTAKLFWDASAESLGIGTSSPASPLTINGTDPLITFENGESPHWQVGFENTQSDRFVFYDNNASAYRMVIDSNGHVGLSHTDFTNYSGKLVVADGSVGGSSFIDIHNNNNNQFVKIGINNNTALIAYDNADEIAFGQMADASGTSLATEHMRIDSSGNVGIGTSSPDTRLDLGSVAASTQTAILARNSTGDADFKLVAGTDSGTASNTSFFEMGIAYETGVYQPNAMLKFFRGGGSTGGFLAFTTNDNTERMRLDGSGNLLVGTTSQSGQITVNNGGNNTGLYVLQSSSSINHTGISVKSSYVTGGQTGTMVRFIQTSDATVGTISSTITATAYNTSSDQRLKDNIVDAPSASDDIDAIQVRSFDWKADGSHQKYGMVAQELQSVAPEAVSTGETEEDMMGVDYSKLVPMMMKEIQSLRARVAQLEGEN